MRQIEAAAFEGNGAQFGQYGAALFLRDHQILQPEAEVFCLELQCAVAVTKLVAHAEVVVALRFGNRQVVAHELPQCRQAGVLERDCAAGGNRRQ